MENGNILVKGDVRYKIGTRIYMETTGVEYYLENVSHSFIYNEDWKTTLQVTRGLKPAERFTKPWNQWAVMTVEDVSEITGMDVKAQLGASGGGSGGGVRGSNDDKPKEEYKPVETKPTDTPKAPEIAQSSAGKMVNPTGDANARISSYYGMRTLNGKTKMHNGIDLPGANGSPMYAAMGGEVTFAGTKGDGYGNYITIKHDNGISTLYAHAHSVGVKQGQKVEAGQQIGKIGNTGYSFGAHIHFEVRENNKPVDPLPYLGVKKK